MITLIHDKNEKSVNPKSPRIWQVDDKIPEYEVHTALKDNGLLVTKPNGLKGLVVTNPNGLKTVSSFAKNQMFTFNGRNLFFGKPEDKFTQDGKVVTSNFFSQDQKYITISQPDLKTINLFMSRLIDVANCNQRTEEKLSQPKDRDIIFNSERRAEIFLPIALGANKPKNIVYIYPWAQGLKNLSPDFEGFDSFVSSGCMIGSELVGIDDEENRRTFIKHKVEFYKSQKIVDFVYVPDDEPNPFETMLFLQLEKNIKLVKAFTNPKKLPTLHYHLPYNDYILYGIELYLANRLTRAALKKFVEFILKKKNVHVSNIQRLCTHHAIKVFIQNPFYNLFDLAGFEKQKSTDSSVDLSTPEEPDILDHLFKQLGLSQFDSLKKKDENATANETEFVKMWMQVLQNAATDKILQATWRECLNLPSKKFPNKLLLDEINSIEELLRVSNGLMIATATQKTNTNTNRPPFVCALEPLSEKQIQHGYTDIQTSSEKMNHIIYPHVINLTYIDPVIPYDQLCKGLLFYNTYHPKSLAALISKNMSANFHEPKNTNANKSETTNLKNARTIPANHSCPNLGNLVPSSPSI